MGVRCRSVPSGSDWTSRGSDPGSATVPGELGGRLPREMTAHVASRGARNTICLLPLTEGPHGICDWDAVASLPGLGSSRPTRTGRTMRNRRPVRRAVRPPPCRDRRAQRRRRAAVGAELRPHTRGHPGSRGCRHLHARRRHRRRLDVGYEACGHMTDLATPDSPLVWEAVSAALTRQPGDPPSNARRPQRPRPVRPRISSESSTPRIGRRGRGRRSGSALATAIDAIVERTERRRATHVRGRRDVRPRRNRRRRRVRPDVRDRRIVAVSPEDEAAEETPMRRPAGAHAASAVTAGDVVVGVSASGRTPYTVAAVESARAARRGQIAVVCVGARQRARARRRPRDPPRRGPRGDRGLDADEGRHSAETGAEHAVDGLLRPSSARPTGT